MAEMFNYSGCKNETAAKKQARIDLAALFYEFLCEKFGKENVGYVDTNEIGFYFGEVNDNDGCPCYMAATVKPTIKNYQDHGGSKRPTKAYDLDAAIQEFKTGNGEG